MLEKDAFKTLLGADLIDHRDVGHDVTLTVRSEGLLRVLGVLRDHPSTLLDQLVDICSVDFPERTLRFEVVYHLLSVHKNTRLRLKVCVEEGESVASAVGLFPSAGWYEREVWDMMGIAFTGHPDLRRLLTDYGFEGHPLRKDFPLTGFQEVRYDEERKAVIYEPVKLQQSYRHFDVESPWVGPKSVSSMILSPNTTESEGR